MNQEPEQTLTVSHDVDSSPKIIQLLIAPNNSHWQGMLLGLANNGDTYRLDSEDGWVIWFDGISEKIETQAEYKLNNLQSSIKLWSDMPAQEMRLRCGEMSKQEILTVRAVLNQIINQQ